jgi:hypothetical protein
MTRFSGLSTAVSCGRGPARRKSNQAQLLLHTPVMPAEAGTQSAFIRAAAAVRSARPALANALPFAWIPAFAGMTVGLDGALAPGSALTHRPG